MRIALNLLLIGLVVLSVDAAGQNPAGSNHTAEKQDVVRHSEDDLVKIGTIDFFGYGDLNPANLRAGLPIQQGQAIRHSDWQSVRSKFDDSLKRMGLRASDIQKPCCDDNGAVMIYIGIAGTSSKPVLFNAPPHGTARLPSDALLLESQFGEGIRKSVMEGAQEDDSNGYALSTEPTLRAAQLAIRKFTLEHSDLVREVLKSSDAAEHRRAAALFLGYDDISAVQVEALTAASRDVDENVRNNAVRAIAVLASSSASKGIDFSAEPFIDLLNSDKWTDRNKGMMALEVLTRSHPTGLLLELRRNSMSGLIEMARWHSWGHAYPARVMLARIAGLDEARLIGDLSETKVEALIATAEKVH